MALLQLEIADAIATLTIDRPQVLNALNREVLRELENHLQALAGRFPEVRGMIITGCGEKAFVAGADIGTMVGFSAVQARAFAEEGHRVLSTLENLPFPVIAAVNGFALGGGLELALACDFILASENAKLGLPEVSLGLIPGFGGTARLTRAVGVQRARELIFTGQTLLAAEALQWGLVNHVHPQDQLLVESRKLLATITSRGPLAVAAAKKTILAGASQSLQEALATEARAFSDLFHSKDMKEGTQAFLEKRKPQFQGQ